MARPPAAPPALTPDPDEPPTTNTRIATELLRAAKVICAHSRGAGGRPLRIGTYLDGILRPAITRDYQETIRRIAAEARQAQRGRRKPGP